MSVPWHNGWDIGLGFIALGALLIWSSGALLVEYRKVFFRNPLALMSLEVLAQIVSCGAAGYLALLCYGIGIYFVVMGGSIFISDVITVAPSYTS